MTKTGAERALQKLIDAEVRVVPMGERIDLQTAGERYLVHLDQVMHRRPTTLQDYTIMLHKHLAPFFAGRSLQRIDTSSWPTTSSPSSVRACRARPSASS